jgi:hypothetical protein
MERDYYSSLGLTYFDVGPKKVTLFSLKNMQSFFLIEYKITKWKQIEFFISFPFDGDNNEHL